MANNYRIATLVFFVVGLSLICWRSADSQQRAEPAGAAEQNGQMFVMDLGPLSAFGDIRKYLEKQGEKEAKAHGLAEEHITRLLKELDEYRILVIDSAKKSKVEGKEVWEFTHRNAPTVVLVRNGGEYVSKLNDPSKDINTPLMVARVDAIGILIAGERKKEFILRIAMDGLSGPGWRDASPHRTRWSINEACTLSPSLDGKAHLLQF